MQCNTGTFDSNSKYAQNSLPSKKWQPVAWATRRSRPSLSLPQSTTKRWLQLADCIVLLKDTAQKHVINTPFATPWHATDTDNTTDTDNSPKMGSHCRNEPPGSDVFLSVPQVMKKVVFHSITRSCFFNLEKAVQSEKKRQIWEMPFLELGSQNSQRAHSDPKSGPQRDPFGVLERAIGSELAGHPVWDRVAICAKNEHSLYGLRAVFASRFLETSLYCLPKPLS